MYTIGDLKSDIADALHGTSLSKLQNSTNLIWRAGRDLLLDIDPQETIRKAQIADALYDDVFDYTPPTDLKGRKIIDIRPQTDRSLGDSPRQTFIKDFDLYKRRNRNRIVIEFDDAVKTLRIDNSTLPGGTTIHDVNSITANGTWSAAGGASNLTLDTLTFKTGGGSLNFNITGASGYVENSDMDAVDLENDEDKSALFVWIYIPDSTLFTSAGLRWGSSSTVYFNRTVTTPHDGNSVVNGWNLFRFNWNGATETGTVDVTAINYLRVTLNATTDTDYRVDNIVSRKGSIYDIIYYSKYLYRTATGTWQEEPGSNTNIINLDVESYNLLFNKCMVLAGQQVGGKDTSFDVAFFQNQYRKNLREYKGQYKSEVLLPMQPYYRKHNLQRKRINIPTSSIN